jgi:hypothetical protein
MVRIAVLTGVFLSAAGLSLGQEPAPGSTGNCVPDARTLCLNNGRFAVTARFRTTTTGLTDATAVGLTADSGYFWFFNPANIEVVVKVLRACSLNNHYWVFGTGLTNVEVTLFVTDTENDTLKTYVNQLGVPFAPIQDTNAFATCP